MTMWLPQASRVVAKSRQPAAQAFKASTTCSAATEPSIGLQADR